MLSGAACAFTTYASIDQGLDEEYLAAMDGNNFMLPGDGNVSGRWRRTPRFEDGLPVKQLN